MLLNLTVSFAELNPGLWNQSTVFRLLMEKAAFSPLICLTNLCVRIP